MRVRTLGPLVMLTLVLGTPSAAQQLPVDDPVLARIWTLGMDSSHTREYAQTLLDSIGPRLTGSPGHHAGNEWLVQTYEQLGIDARNEEYGTWMGWDRGVTHIDLVEPRVRTLEGMMLAWSPGTDGETVEAPVITLPETGDPAAFEAWLPQVEGKFVLASFPEPTCRPDTSWQYWAMEGAFERMDSLRDAARDAWRERFDQLGLENRDLGRALEEAGAVGVITSRWSRGWGVSKIFSSYTEEVPTVNLSCEDYGLVYRLAENDQGPVLRLEADAEFLGEVPVYNTVAVIPGTEKPDEYVMLSAHFDSWDGGSGATDNGTGTITMLEAMRLLKAAYPNPKRTIVVAHWGGEEQGLNGSRAFAADHPEIVQGLQALFNQDNGTGRVSRISMQGLLDAGAHFGNWLSRVPAEITQHIDLITPGNPGGGGSDYAAFVCYGAPAFSLSSNSWEYGTYTWHTNRDTYDKISFRDLKNNATLTAMLVYLASEDPATVGRSRRVLPVDDDTGEQRTWPECRVPERSWQEGMR